MPTDEQLREQFEAFLASWFDECDRAMLAPKELTKLKAAYEAGHLSRDAEVQRLVAALTSMVVEFDPNSENEIAAHKNAVMLLAEYLPEKEAADAE